jgi:hypothetical protein
MPAGYLPAQVRSVWQRTLEVRIFSGTLACDKKIDNFQADQ